MSFPPPRLALLALALATHLACAAAPSNPQPLTTQQQTAIKQLVARELQAASPGIASQAASEVTKTVEGEKQSLSVMKDMLEAGRKNVDWWLGFLSLLLAGAAFFVWRTNQQSRQEWEAMRNRIDNDHKQALKDTKTERDELRQEMRECIDDARERFNQHLASTEGAVRLLDHDLDNARKMLAEIQQHRDSAVTPRRDEAKPGDIEAAIRANEANAEHSAQSKLASIAQKLEKKHEWKGAAERWQALTDLEPDNASYWFNYGYAIHEWMNSQQDSALRQRLASKAAAIWQQVIELSENAAAYHNWGNALGDWARTLSGEAQQQRFAEACDKYAAATRMQPDDAITSNNWGGTLLRWSHTLTGLAREAKQQEAEGLLLKAKAAGNKDLYNLACLRALQQRPDEARELLQQTRDNGYLPDYEHLSTDPDLDNLRDLDWFKQLLKDMPLKQDAKTVIPA